MSNGSRGGSRNSSKYKKKVTGSKGGTFVPTKQAKAVAKSKAAKAHASSYVPGVGSAKNVKAQGSKGGTFVPTKQAKAVAKSKAAKASRQKVSARTKLRGRVKAVTEERVLSQAGQRTGKSVGAFRKNKQGGPKKPRKSVPLGARHKLVHKGAAKTSEKITSQYQQRTGKSQGVFRTGDKRKASTQKMMESLYHPTTQRSRPTRGERARTVKSVDSRTGKVTTKRVNYGRHKGRG